MALMTLSNESKITAREREERLGGASLTGYTTYFSPVEFGPFHLGCHPKWQNVHDSASQTLSVEAYALWQLTADESHIFGTASNRVVELFKNQVRRNIELEVPLLKRFRVDAPCQANTVDLSKLLGWITATLRNDQLDILNDIFRLCEPHNYLLKLDIALLRGSFVAKDKIKFWNTWRDKTADLLAQSGKNPKEYLSGL